MKLSKFIILLIFLTGGCNHIETDNTLTEVDKQRIIKLHLLDQDEKIIKFYSEFNNKVAGNFITNKRVAKYWLDEDNINKNKVSSAFYDEIKSLDTVYLAGKTYCPYLLVTKKDNTQFKVSVDGKHEEIKSFFEDAINNWRQNQDAR
jgi:hypothetical protein